ncbi:serine/threonine protein kinase [Pseudenhygromyxa sp. WMMC2535]|uniref:protein kinase domain-containing protein n=1 Tax=Pseudenhygromyxa sp. WMMC2535 TaxID=2712867 RepID=UPI001556DE30|nr:serine/threonine protein kinase [Pseudenhygromyxa sp. WMMC2535]
MLDPRYEFDIADSETTRSSEVGPLSPRLPLPEQLGHFRVRRVLGEGAMGVVYEAIDEDLDRRVAIKLVRPTSRSRQRQRRLLREAQAMARLTHPNVVVVYEVGSVGEQVFIAMEYVEGPTLERWLSEGVGEGGWEASLRLFVQAGRGVHAAHEAGLVHRDFKPENVLIGDDGRVRVADFGLALPELELELEPGRAEGPRPRADALTKTGVLVGTPAYMAPEVLAGGRADALSDQFSFCVALYEALYGHRPFTGVDLPALLADIETRRLRPPSRAHPVPSWVHAALVRGLGARAGRWPSMEALLRALDPDLRARRRALAIGGTLSAATLAIATAAFVGLGGQPELCERAGDPIPLWTEDTRAGLRDALLGLELADPQATALAVDARLDAYASEWQGAREQSCEATRVLGQQSEALMDARMRCLDGHAREFEALVGVLLDADAASPERAAKVGQRAVSAAESLPALSRCADLDYLTAEIPPPPPAVASEVAAGYRALSEVRALERAGRFEDARAEVEGLAAAAAESAYSPLIAEVELARGLIFDDLAEADTSAAAYERAYLEAEAHGAFFVAQSAALALTHVVGYRQGEVEAALRWADLAEAKIRYTGDDASRVELALNRGEALESSGDYSAAREAYAEALSLHEGAANPSPLLRAEILDDLGLIELELSNYELAQAHLERAQALWTAEVGRGHPLAGRGLNSLGALYVRTGRYREAGEAFEGALDIWIASKGPRSDDVAAMHNNLGVIYRVLEQPERAREHLERALEIREARLGREDLQVARVLDNLGSLELEREDHRAALEIYGRALAISNGQLEADDLLMARRLQGLGLAQFGLGQIEPARASFARALEIREARLPAGHNFITNVRAPLIAALLELGPAHLGAARRQLDLALAESRDRPPEEAARCVVGPVHARVLWAEGDHARARAVAAEGLRDCRTNDPQNNERSAALEGWLAAHPDE